jgi:hypothetical protein
MRLEPCRAPGGRQRAPGVRPSISIQRFVLSLAAPKQTLWARSCPANVYF